MRPSLKQQVQRAEQTLSDCIQRLERRPYRIALLGEAGSGKSSLINRIVGDYVAEIGVIETTRDAQAYPTPHAPLTVVDLPGYGTQSRPTEHFIEDFDLRQYDGVLLIYSARIKTDDLQIYQNLKTYNIPCYVVRNSIDIALEGERASGKKNALEYKELVEEITQDARVQLRERDLHVYPVSAHPDRPAYALNTLLSDLQDAARNDTEEQIHDAIETIDNAWRDGSRLRRARFFARLAARTLTTPVPHTRLTLGMLVSAYALTR